jgi:hypothetical protein
MNLDNFWVKRNRRFRCFFDGEDSEKYKKSIEMNLKRWEKLPLNFFQYRHILKGITAKWHLAECIDLKTALKISDEQIVFLPIDDDDIVRPDLLAKLEEAFRDPDVDAVEWKSWCHSTMGTRLEQNPVRCECYFIEPWMTPNRQIMVPSNGYAIRSNLSTFKRLVNHVHYSDEEDLRRVSWDDPACGLRFVHPASMFLSQRANTIRNTLNVLSRAEIPCGVEWATEAIDEVYELTASLVTRRKLML